MIKEAISLRDQFFKANPDSKSILLEASGNMSLSSIGKVAETGIDYISVGAITKHLHAIDLSLRVK